MGGGFRDVPVATAVFGSARALAVPATAIVRDQDRTRVYVQRTPEALELRDVKIGRTNGASIEITNGLKDGERIVVKGAETMPRRN